MHLLVVGVPQKMGRFEYVLDNGGFGSHNVHSPACDSTHVSAVLFVSILFSFCILFLLEDLVQVWSSTGMVITRM